MSALLPHLLELLEEASSGLRNVTRRKMFGCEAMFVNGNIYALIWKTGRIGVRVPEGKQFEELMAKSGSEPWSPGGKMQMRHWVLVPENFHDDTDALTSWVKRAHALNAEAPAKAPAAKKKPATKKAPVAKTKKPAAKKK